MNRRTPFISVVIPARNRPMRLRACLASLARQRYPQSRCEVVVVYDGSRPPLQIAMKPLVQHTKILRMNRSRGPAFARNRGVKSVKGDLIVFTDDDCVAPSDWLANIARRAPSATGRVICGRVRDLHPENAYSRAGQAFWEALIVHFNADPNDPRSMNSANMAMPKSLFLDMDGFDESLQRLVDREFCERIRQAGWSMVYHPEIWVFHAHPDSFRTFWRQHHSWGKGAYDLRFRHREKRPRLGFEPLCFYLKLMAGPLLSQPGSSASVTTAALLAMSQAATLFGFLQARRLHHRMGETNIHEN